MAPGYGTYNLTTLRQLQGQFDQFGLNQFGGGCEVSSWFNSAFDVANSLEGITSSDSNQAASSVQNLINKALSLVEKLMGQEAQAARKEVKKNEEDAKKLGADAEKTKTAIMNDMNGIGNDIKEEQGVVEAATEEIKKAQEEIQKKQKEINEIIEKISKAKKDLAKETNPAKQKALLKTIQGLSLQIATVTESMANIQQNVEDASKEVADSVSYIEALKGNAVEVQENGEMEIEQLGQKAVNNAQANTQTQVKAKTNQVTAEGAKDAAQAASSNFLTGTSIAPKLYRVATDQELAGTTRNVGAAATLNTLLQGIGKINDNLSLLTQFNTSIGSALQGYADYVGGEWNTAMNGVITSLGSFDGDNGLNTQIETLNSAVDSDIKTIDNVPAAKENNNKKETNDNNSDKESNNNLATPNVEIKKFNIKK